MREIRPYGSVRGARRKARPYRDKVGSGNETRLTLIYIKSFRGNWCNHGCALSWRPSVAERGMARRLPEAGALFPPIFATRALFRSSTASATCPVAISPISSPAGGGDVWVRPAVPFVFRSWAGSHVDLLRCPHHLHDSGRNFVLAVEAGQCRSLPVYRREIGLEKMVVLLGGLETRGRHARERGTVGLAFKIGSDDLPRSGCRRSMAQHCLRRFCAGSSPRISRGCRPNTFIMCAGRAFRSYPIWESKAAGRVIRPSSGNRSRKLSAQRRLHDAAGDGNGCQGNWGLLG